MPPSPLPLNLGCTLASRSRRRWLAPTMLTFLAAALGPTPALAQRPLGIDVSYWQGTLSQQNWDDVIGSGRTFAFARCTHYSLPPPDETDAHGSPDTTFPTNMIRARNAGVLVGAYHFARPSIRDPQTEADFFVYYATQYWTQYAPDGPDFLRAGFLRPVLDLEDGSSTSHVGAASLSAWAAAWMDAVKLQTGIEPMIYCGGNYSHLLDSSFASRTLWFANWTYPANVQTANPSASMSPWPSPGGWTFWQYGGGSVPGVPGNVDLDVFNGTAAMLQNYVIVNPPMIVVNPTTLNRAVPPGSNLPQETFTINNDTTVTRPTLNYTISDNATWLSVSPGSGTSSGAPVTHTITYSTASLGIGNYTCNITISDPSASPPSKTLPVSLTVAQPGDFDGDLDVDMEDFAFFQNCYGGPPIASNCAAANLNGDNVVGLSDYTLFQGCLSGPDIPAAPQCAG